MRVGAIVPLFLVGLVAAPAFADEVPAGMVMTLSGSTSPPLAAMSEIPSASPLQLAAGTELTFLHYAKCKLITVTGGTLTLTRTDFAADGKIVAEKDGPCPRVHQLGANTPGTTSGGLVMRGSMPIGDVEKLLGVEFGDKTDEAVTTLAGLLSHVSGKVPTPGDKIDLAEHRFEVLEANQRKVLRVRIRKQMKAVPTKL